MPASSISNRSWCSRDNELRIQGEMMTPELQKILVGLCRHPSWNVHHGYGSFITFEFGKPHLKVNKFSDQARKRAPSLRKRTAYVRGDWHLWIYCCAWVYRESETVISRWNSSDKRIDQACARLNGQILKLIEIDTKKARTVFRFDLGGELTTSSYDDELLEHWMLYCPNGKVFTFRSDGCFSHQSGKTEVTEQEFRPLTELSRMAIG